MRGANSTPRPQDRPPVGHRRERSQKALARAAGGAGAIGGAAVDGKQNPDGILTERQRRLVNALVQTKLNWTAAAREAGYNPNALAAVIHNAKHNPKILKAIAKETEEFARVSAMTKKRVIDGLLEAIDIARIQADPTPMIQGWTQIAKLCGFMEPTKHKLEVSVNGNVVIQKLQQLDDSQLLALAEGDSSVIDGEFEVVDK